MAPNTGSIADFHPADTDYNPAIRRHHGRPAAYRRSPLSAQLDPEAISALETPATDRSNRPRLTIQTSNLSTSPEPAGDEADTPHPSQDDGSSSADEVLDSHVESQGPATTATSGPVSPLDPTTNNDRSTGDKPLSPVSPIAGPSTVGPPVRIANETQPRRPSTPLQQQRETLRDMLRDFDRHILEPGEGEHHWTRFRGALQPAVQTLATDQIIHALKQHLPSVQKLLSQNAQLRGALVATQARQDANEVEMERLRRESRSLRGALDRLQISGDGNENIKDPTVENEQMKIELEKAQKELQDSFDEREIEEGNLRMEINATEEALCTLQRKHDAVLADHYLLRTQAQQSIRSVQRAQQEAREAGQEAAALRAQLQEAQANSTATTDQITMLEGQLRDALGVVLDLRGEIFNLEARMAKGKQRESIGDVETTKDKPTNTSHSPDSPESYPAPTSPPPSPPPTRPARDPPTPAENNTTGASSPVSPLEQARRNLLADRGNIASIIDPLEASAYATRSVSKRAIGTASASGLAAAQIVKAIRDHLPDIRDRQRIKAAYRRLEGRRADDHKLAEQLRAAGANKQRALDGWRMQVKALQSKLREVGGGEGEGEEEEEKDWPPPVAEPIPVTTTTAGTTAGTSSSESESTRQTTTVSVLRQHNALLVACDEVKTSQLQSAQRDVARLEEESGSLRSALDAAAAAAMTNDARQAARIAALGTQLADCRAENSALRTRLADVVVGGKQAEDDRLRARLAGRDAQTATLRAQVAEQARTIGKLRTTQAATRDYAAGTRVAAAAAAAAEEERRRERGDGRGTVTDANIAVNTTVAEGWRSRDHAGAGASGVDFLAFWLLWLVGLEVGWWVVGGGEVGVREFLRLLVWCGWFAVGVVGWGVWRARLVLVDVVE